MQNRQTGGDCANGGNSLGLEELHDSVGEVLGEHECLVWGPVTSLRLGINSVKKSKVDTWGMGSTYKIVGYVIACSLLRQ